jgi:hypothetical protein
MPEQAAKYPSSTVAAPNRQLLSATFAVLGLGTSVLWNQLLLSTDVLIMLFGESALSQACLSQNLCCAATMIGLTFFPVPWSRSASIRIAAGCYALMVAVGAALVYCLHTENLPRATFVALVAADGVLTGLVQLQVSGLAGFLSICQDCPDESTEVDLGSALLVGEAASPLVTTAIYSVVQTLGRSPYEQAVITISVSGVFLVTGVALSWSLLRMQLELSEPLPLGKQLKDDPEDGSENYFWKAMRKLRPFACAIFCCGAVWIFLLCSFPYIASGLCTGQGSARQTADCTTKLPSMMVVAANSAAFFGRVLGKHLPKHETHVLYEASAFLVLGPLAAHMSESDQARTLSAAFDFPMGIALSGILILWCNCLLIRLFALAQGSVSHSLANRCPITSQVTWVALQVGCVVGTGMSFLQAL